MEEPYFVHYELFLAIGKGCGKQKSVRRAIWNAATRNGGESGELGPAARSRCVFSSTVVHASSCLLASLDDPCDTLQAGVDPTCFQGSENEEGDGFCNRMFIFCSPDSLGGNDRLLVHRCKLLVDKGGQVVLCRRPSLYAQLAEVPLR